MDAPGFVIVVAIVVIILLWKLNEIIASHMEEAAAKKGYGEEAHVYKMCFWLGAIGYLYTIALPDLNQQKKLDKIIKLLAPQTPKYTPPRDVTWNFQDISPETPSGDGSAEEHLYQIGKTPEEFICDTLVVTGIKAGEECFVCRQKPKATKLCRIKCDGECNDIPICTDCINAFIEYNPKSVYDLETKE